LEDDRDIIDVMVSIMRAKRASTRTVELAAGVIAADARLNSRIGDAKAQSKLGDRILYLIDFGESVLTECKSIAHQFEDGLSQEGLCERLLHIAKKIDETNV